MLYSEISMYVQQPRALCGLYIACAHLQGCMQQSSYGSSTQMELARCMLGDGEDQTNKKSRRRRRRGKVFNTKPLKKKKRETSPDTGSTLYPSNLLCSQLPAPAIRRGATGGHIGAIFAPMAPVLTTAFKVLYCDVHGLDVCLVPYMQSYHYPCLLTIAGPVFVTSAALCLGLWHDCTVDLFSFTYRSLCLFFFLFFCTQTVYHVWISLWSDDLENLLPLSPCDTSAALMRSAVFQITRGAVGEKCACDVRHTLALRFALCSRVFYTRDLWAFLTVRAITARILQNSKISYSLSLKWNQRSKHSRNF